MGVFVPPGVLTNGVLGASVKKTHTIATETRALYTVTGLVLVTSLVGVVTTAMTVANTVKIQANPTVGTTSDLIAATDLGTTDTPAGNLLCASGSPAEGFLTGIGAVAKFPTTEPAGTTTAAQTGGIDGIYVNAGSIEAVVTGTSPDGVIDWYVNYVAISPDGKIVAA
jgi:hypothetical protein